MPTDKVPFSFTNIHHVTVFFSAKVIISFFSIFRYLVFVPEGFRQEKHRRNRAVTHFNKTALNIHRVLFSPSIVV